MARLKQRLFVPPRLADRSHERHATWLELFLDLVVVVAVTNVGNLLHDHVTFKTAVEFLGFYVPVYWSWLGHAVYETRFDTDDLIERMLTFGLMIAGLGMALGVRHLDDHGTFQFAASFIGARVCLLLLYARAYFHLPDSRPVTRLYLRGFSLGLACWAISLAAPGPLRFGWWMLGLAIDLLTPWVGRGTLRRFPVDPGHLPERMGLFTLIVLGEALIAVEGSLALVPVAGAWVVAALLAFGVAVGIWWLYYTFLLHAELEKRLGSGLTYMYWHLALSMGISVLAVGLGRLVLEAAGLRPSASTLDLVGAGAAIWFAAFFGLMWKTDRRHLGPAMRAGFAFAIAASGALIWIGRDLPPNGALAFVFAIFFMVVALDLRYGLPASPLVQLGPEGQEGDRGPEGRPAAEVEPPALGPPGEGA